MTPEERDELRRDLEAAGCPIMAEYATHPLLHMGQAGCAELRSLLRREKPEPITEAGLRSEGFVESTRMPGGVLVRWIAGRIALSAGLTAGCRLLTPDGEWLELHIDSMQRLREVIAALEGSDANNNESEESK